MDDGLIRSLDMEGELQRRARVRWERARRHDGPGAGTRTAARRAFALTYAGIMRRWALREGYIASVPAWRLAREAAGCPVPRLP